MFLRRTATALSSRALRPSIASRSFVTSAIRRDAKHEDSHGAAGHTPAGAATVKEGVVVEGKRLMPKGQEVAKLVPFSEIKSEEDLLPPGASAGEVPTDYLQATGLERLEILGKMDGVDVFDMKPLESSRLGTLDNPIVVKSFGDEQYCGCTGSPADSHNVVWLTVSRERPVERCTECGSVYQIEYVGPPDDPHAHHHGPEFPEPKSIGDYVKPEYYWR